jgi:hypothetical protein
MCVYSHRDLGNLHAKKTVVPQVCGLQRLLEKLPFPLSSYVGRLGVSRSRTESKLEDGSSNVVEANMRLCLHGGTSLERRCCSAHDVQQHVYDGVVDPLLSS